MSIYIDEASDLIAEEGLLAEWFIEFKINETHYVLGAMLAPYMKSPNNTNSTNKLNALHKNMVKKCLIKVSSVKYSYLLQAKD